VRGKDRNEAIPYVARSRDVHRGRIYTTIPLHRRILADPGIRAGKFDTGLSRIPREELEMAG